MIYKWGKWLFISLIVLVLSACDSGGSNNAPTIDTNKEKNTTLNVSKVDDTNKTLYRGKFIDSPVGGLSYSVGDVSGVTDKNGYFQYKELNEDIFFYIGKLNIGIAKASENIHISDLKGSLGDYQIDKNTRIAQILLSLDIDGNPDNNIQLPDNLEKVFDGNTDFSLTVLSEEDFEKSLLKKLEALNIKKMVTIDEAKKHINETAIELAQFCALPNPKNYNDKGQEILGLSCIDKARLEYFSRIIYPQLASNINAEYAQTVVVEESYNEEAAQRAIDTNPILSSLKVLDSAVDTVDSALKGETLGMYANISTTILKAVQLYVNASIVFKDNPETTEEMAIEFNKQVEFTSLITSTFFNVPSCYSVIKTGKDSGGSCAKAIQDGLNAYKINLELDDSLKTIEDEQAKENIDTLINSVAVLSGTIELAKSKNGAEAMSALFGITNSIIPQEKQTIFKKV